MNDATVIAPHTSIPGYRIISTLGQGGMATVYLAEQSALGRKVALKVLSRNALGDDDWGDRFLRETKILASFNDRNIVSIYDAGRHENSYYLAMECLNGGVLTDRIKLGLSQVECIQIIIDIASALKIAHDSGFVHRDLKPDNIMFRSEQSKEAVLTDFGIARVFNKDKSQVKTEQLPDITTHQIIIGSLSYMSPEQSRAQPLDSRSDIFSLGVCFYYALTQRRPFQASNLEELWHQHRDATSTQLPGKLSALQPIIDKMLALDPNDRYFDASEIIKELREIDLTASVELAKTEPYTNIKPEPDRKFYLFKKNIFALAILIAPALIGLAYYLKEYKTSNEITSISPERSDNFLVNDQPDINAASKLETGYTIKDIIAYRRVLSGELSEQSFLDQYPNSIFTSIINIRQGNTDLVQTIKNQADDGSAPAQFLYSEIADQKLAPNLKRGDALLYAEQASEQNYPLGTVQYAALLLGNPDGFSSDDLLKAKSLLEKASSMGEVLSNRVLGLLTLNQQFDFFNAEQGLDYLVTAANAGDTSASEELASIYSQGYFVPRNEELASKYLKMSKEM